jgi:hypothetical protein
VQQAPLCFSVQWAQSRFKHPLARLIRLFASLSSCVALSRKRHAPRKSHFYLRVEVHWVIAPAQPRGKLPGEPSTGLLS